MIIFLQKALALSETRKKVHINITRAVKIVRQLTQIAIPAFAFPGRLCSPLDRQEKRMPSPEKTKTIGKKQHIERIDKIPMTRESVAKVAFP